MAQNSVKFSDTIIDEHFFKGKTMAHQLPVPRGDNGDSWWTVFLCIIFYFGFCSSFFVLNRHGWKPFFIRDIIWFSLLFFHQTFGASILYLYGLMQWCGSKMKQGLCRSIVWEIMQSHVVDQTHHQPEIIIMSTTKIIITIHNQNHCHSHTHNHFGTMF